MSSAASADVAAELAWEFVTNHHVRALVANDPDEHVGECARKVAATIAFIDDTTDDDLLFEMGRWAETPQRAETGRLGLSLEEWQLDIDANALLHALDIAMKAPEDARTSVGSTTRTAERLICVWMSTGWTSLAVVFE